MYLITIISTEEWHLDDPQIAMIWALGPLCFEAQTLSVWVVIFFGFLEVFATLSVQQCQLLISFVFVVFLMLCY